jgi:hypothetical protein
MKGGLSLTEETPMFLNFYKCERCGFKWTDEWPCTCDDDCRNPKCGARHMSPYKSEDAQNEAPRFEPRGRYP